MFFPLSELKKKTFGLLAKIFWQLCENCFQCVHRVFLRGFFEKQIPFIILANWATPFWHWVGDFRAGLSEILANFLIISGYWAKNFRSFDEKKAVGLPKLLSTCLQEQFEKFFSWKKVSSFFRLFFSETKRTKVWFFSNFSTGVVGSVFYVSIGTFASKNVF